MGQLHRHFFVIRSHRRGFGGPRVHRWTLLVIRWEAEVPGAFSASYSSDYSYSLELLPFQH